MQPNGDWEGMEGVAPISTAVILKRRKKKPTETPLQSRGISLCLPQELSSWATGHPPGSH